MQDKYIWNYLLSRWKNPYGVAAMMGNLMAESSLNPSCANTKNKNYLNDAEKGIVDFVNDKVAFGLVQWCYYTRKRGLLNLAKEQNKSVGNIDVQLEYLCDEIKKYKTAYNAVLNGTDIREITETVMLRYEKPANTSEKAKTKRTNYAKQFYAKFASEIKLSMNRNLLSELEKELKTKL